MANGLFGTGAQIAPLRQTAIQPAGIPGSTFVRPQERQVGGNLKALADALGSLNGALQSFANVQSQKENDPKSRENEEWIARRQQMTAEQLREEAKNGTPDGVRVREDALNSLLGERANDDFRKKWLEHYNTDFDRSNGNADAEYQRMRDEYAAALPNEIAKGNFFRLTGDHHRAWVEKDTEDKMEFAKQQVNTTVIDSFRNAVSDARRGGKSATDAARMVFAKSASNRDFLGLSGQEQNDTVFRLAEEYALQGDEDMTRALLEGQRTGADGRPLPSLRKTAGYSDRAIKLLEQAGNMRDKEFRERNLTAQVADDDLVLRGAFTKAEADKRMGKPGYNAAVLSDMMARSTSNLVHMQKMQAEQDARREQRRVSDAQETSILSSAYSSMGRLGGVEKLKDQEVASYTGEGTRTVTRKQQIEAVTEMKEQEFQKSQQALIDGGKSPEDAKLITDRLRVDWYAGNKLVNDDWKSVLNGIAGIATTDTLLQKGQVSAYLKQNAKLYRQLKAVNPAYLSTLVTDPKSKQFLEAFDSAIIHRKMPEDEALTYAALWTAKPESEKARTMIPHDKAEKLAKSTLGSLDLDSRNMNQDFVMSRIAELSLNGATEGEIATILEREVAETAVPINGVLVFANNDLPDDFPELMEGELKKRFETIGARYGLTDPKDLYVASDGTESKWYVYSKSHPGLVVGTAPITKGSLEATRQEKRVAHEAEVRKMATAKDAERAKFKVEYDATVKSERERIEYYRQKAAKRKGIDKTLAGYIADRLQQNLDEKLAGDNSEWSKQRKDLQDRIKKGSEKDKADAQARLEWLKSFIPEVQIGNKVVIDGWNVNRDR